MALISALVDKQTDRTLKAEVQGAVEDGVAKGIGDIGIGTVVEEEFYIVLLIAHDGPEKRSGAAGSASIHIGSMGDQKLHQLVVAGGKFGEVERRIAVLQLVRGHSLGIECIGCVGGLGVQEDDGVLMVAGGEFLAQIVGDEGRVVVFDLHVGAGVDEDLGDSELAVQSGLMQGGIAAFILVVDELGIGGEEFLNLLDVTFAGRVVDGAAEGGGGEGEGREGYCDGAHKAARTRRANEQGLHFLNSLRSEMSGRLLPVF